MKIGITGYNVHELGVYKCIDQAKSNEFEGVFFKSILDLSPKLDMAELKDIRAYADDAEMYLEVGLAKVNPYITCEDPRARDLGDGDIELGFQKMISASRLIGCTELMVRTGGWIDYPGIFGYDRFRTDAPWDDQLNAIEKFLQRLAPVLRDQQCRLNIETHEEITSFEVIRLVESVGDDVMGVLFDTGNVLVRGEDPVEAAKRVAPYVHLTHIKDAILIFAEDGLMRQIRPCGEGIVEWEVILPILWSANENLNLTLEDHKGFMPIQVYQEEWLKTHPDLTNYELSKLFKYAHESEKMIHSGTIMRPSAYEEIPFENQVLERIEKSRQHLKAIIKAKNLHGCVDILP